MRFPFLIFVRDRWGGGETGIVNKIRPNGDTHTHTHTEEENTRYTPIMETSIAAHSSSSGSSIAEHPAAQDEKTLGHEYNFPVRRTIA